MNKKGFTLMEMMAVIAILGILASIIMPTLARRIDYAKQAATVANIKNLETCVGLYHADTGAYPESINAAHATWTSIEILGWRLTGIDPDTKEVDLDIVNDSSWQGPYIKGISTDAWNKEFVYLYNRFPKDEPPYSNQVLGLDYPLCGNGSPVMPPSNFDFYIYSKGRDKKTSSDGDLRTYESPIDSTRDDHDDDINNWDLDKNWLLYY